MAKHFSCEAIVLQTYDVGEADRFCILFTKERGRIAARANGVRKLKSRKGGCLLQMSHITADVSETKTGFLITGAQLKSEKEERNDIDFFYRGQQAMELLLALLHDEEPLPDVFDLTQQFIGSDMPSLPFSIQLLHRLGLFPDTDNSIYTQNLSPYEHTMMKQCIDGTWSDSAESEPAPRLAQICQMLIAEQLSRPLRTQLVPLGI